MKRIACTNIARAWPTPALVCLLSAGLAACGGSPAPAPAPREQLAAMTVVQDAASGKAFMACCAGHVSYRLLTIDRNSAPISGLQINRRGHVQYSVIENGAYRAKFFNGRSVSDLGNLGGNLTLARAENDLDQVTGVSNIASGRNRPFLWTERGGMVDLGTLGGTPGREAASGMDVNNKGQVVGFSTTNTQFNVNHPFFWSKATGMIDLGTIGPSIGGAALAINDKAQVAGDMDAGVEAIHAFFWTRAGGMIDLGTLGGAVSMTVDINEAGVVVGNSSTAHTPEVLLHAFVWDQASGMIDLGTLGGTESNAAAINLAGQVVGIANTAPGFGHAFVWSRRGGMLDLGTLGGNLSRATAINDSGQVVGMSQLPGDVEHAFVWCAGQGMVDLNSLMRGAPAGLVLSTALAISRQGEIVAMSNMGLVLLKPASGGNH